MMRAESIWNAIGALVVILPLLYFAFRSPWLVAVGAVPSALSVLIVMAAWWAVAALVGAFVGRKAAVAPAIGRLLADAKAATMMPEHRPGATILNRLWPLLLLTVATGAIAFLAPQVPGMAAGFAIIWALAWRRQESAVAAIEERDAVRFYVDKTSPLSPIQLVRTPGFGGTFLAQP